MPGEIDSKAQTPWKSWDDTIRGIELVAILQWKRRVRPLFQIARSLNAIEDEDFQPDEFGNPRSVVLSECCYTPPSLDRRIWEVPEDSPEVVDRREVNLLVCPPARYGKSQRFLMMARADLGNVLIKLPRLYTPLPFPSPVGISYTFRGKEAPDPFHHEGALLLVELTRYIADPINGNPHYRVYQSTDWPGRPADHRRAYERPAYWRGAQRAIDDFEDLIASVIAGAYGLWFRPVPCFPRKKWGPYDYLALPERRAGIEGRSNKPKQQNTLEKQLRRLLGGYYLKGWNSP
jgi:hypothetical protein